MDEIIRVPAIRVEQPIGEFFSGVMRVEDLLRISSADMRTIEKELDRYVGIQRKLDPGRVAEIAKFVDSKDATFPTSVVLSVPGGHAYFDELKKELVLTAKHSEDETFIDLADLAKILDGQHRVEGLREAGRKRFDVPVSIFVDADIADQAYVFATVNLAQTKVNKSLVYDLFDYAKARSPQKTCHEIAVALDSFQAGPMYQMIKRLGTATPGRPPGRETLAQATFVGALLPMLSEDPEEDRYELAKGRKVKAEQERYLKTPFRFLWVAERDTTIAQILVNFFAAVAERWNDGWTTRAAGHVLPRTNGFRALMRLLQVLYVAELPTPNETNPVVSKERFLSYLNKATLGDYDFNVQRFNPGSGGESAIFKSLLDEIGLTELPRLRR
ncbi:DGQHR domain-containing protein [Stenotrophomonas sp. GD03701]|uniref:DGQHR domain-containing protein n=1 Tax=Stenotrophomonas maltophilia TaxID=40324 RepID=A0AAW3S834_STEMA|nr:MULTISPECIES: DGQHR domain-containing protein [Stenotrophomonas]MBA0312233.1 DGQHR domain-containing protein [Stenotrophomonas maltophilia]MDH1387295.1 DGQHR domain-containing protein [Stenotrophomonas sp. GD03701]MDH1391387.1 DGQHR domain-containing protein [Stenotrophomonas sp. GD03702]